MTSPTCPSEDGHRLHSPIPTRPNITMSIGSLMAARWTLPWTVSSGGASSFWSGLYRDQSGLKRRRRADSTLYHFQGILVHPAQRPTLACWGVTAGCTSIFQIWYYAQLHCVHADGPLGL